MAKRVVTEEHKAAMKAGRASARAVDKYLNAIDQPKRRGRPVSVDELQRQERISLGALDHLGPGAELEADHAVDERGV